MSRWLRRDTYCGAKLTTTKTLEMHNIIQYYAQAAGYRGWASYSRIRVRIPRTYCPTVLFNRMLKGLQALPKLVNSRMGRVRQKIRNRFHDSDMLRSTQSLTKRKEVL